MTVPESIRSAAAGHSVRKPVGIRMPVSRGQIRIVRDTTSDPGSEQMVLVVRVDSKHGFAEVMLVHPYTELATGTDLVVSVEHSTLPYGIVVETDTRAVVWTDQLGTKVGVFDFQALEALGDVAVGQAVYRMGISSGTSLSGPLDPRWDFKAAEGTVIRHLAADCTSTLLADETPLQRLAACDDVKLRIRTLLDILIHDDIEFTMEDVAKLEQWGLLERSNWIDEFGRSGLESFDFFWLLFEEQLTNLNPPLGLVA